MPIYVLITMQYQTTLYLYTNKKAKQCVKKIPWQLKLRMPAVTIPSYS